ncbi:MAG: hypothetical protein FWJ62_07320 [Thermaerobacter sp.]|nr:hypothetical protein [Bacillota bacterium]REJ32313.1 MAG: hypothetical protein DIU84_10285 [Bacillota bacterium]
MWDVVLAGAWGLLVGGINHVITARALNQMAAAGADAKQAQAAIRKVQGAFQVRLLVSLAGLAAAYGIWGEPLPVGVAAAALLLVNILSPWQNQRRRRGG